MSKPMMERPSSKHCRQSPERMLEQNEATSGGSTSGIAWNGLYGFSTNFDDWAASLLAEIRTRRLHPAQSMAQGLLLRKDRPPAGVFLLMLVGWAEEPERRSHNHACCNAGDWNSHSKHHTSQATQKQEGASLMPGRAGAASITSIIGARPGPGGQHHEHHWRLVSPFQGKPKHSLLMPKRRGSAPTGKCSSNQLQVQSSSGNRHHLTEFWGGPFPTPLVATFG